MKSAIEIRKKKTNKQKKQEFVLVRTVTRRTYAFRKRLTSKFFVFYLFFVVFVVILSSLLFFLFHIAVMCGKETSVVFVFRLYMRIFFCVQIYFNVEWTALQTRLLSNL